MGVNKDKLTRGLDDTKLKKFKNSKWYDFYIQNQNELFLGIRNNYINLYYKGMNIAKLQGRFEKAIIAYKYLGIEGKSKYKSIFFEDYEKIYYKTIKPNVEKHVKDEKKNLKEKVTQQNLILNNNEQYKKHKSNWLCIDMEYIKPRKNKKDHNGKSYGRFDIIAVNINQKPYRVALIELKLDDGAIGGNSGIRKHAEDWNEFKKKDLFTKSPYKDNKDAYLAKEIVDIINNQYYLDKTYPIKRCCIEDFKGTNPEFYFLICSGERSIDNVKNTVRKYLWSKDRCKKYGIFKVSSENIEDKMGYDISTYLNDEKLYCRFLFAKGFGDDIKDIIEDSKYNKEIK